MHYLDDGTVEPVGIIAWFPDYMIIAPWETLVETGQVEFVIVSTQ